MWTRCHPEAACPCGSTWGIDVPRPGRHFRGGGVLARPSPYETSRIAREARADGAARPRTLTRSPAARLAVGPAGLEVQPTGSKSSRLDPKLSGQVPKPSGGPGIRWVGSTVQADWIQNRADRAGTPGLRKQMRLISSESAAIVALEGWDGVGPNHRQDHLAVRRKQPSSKPTSHIVARPALRKSVQFQYELVSRLTAQPQCFGSPSSPTTPRSS